MDIEQLYTHLNLYVSISYTEVEQLFSSAYVLQLKKRECLFKAGDFARYVAFVNKGCLRYYYLDDKGEEHIIYFAQEGWWVGDLSSFYAQKPTQHSLQALEPCELFAYTIDSFEKVRADIAPFDEYCKIRHARATEARLEEMMSQRSQTAEERYLKLLKSFPTIFQRVPQHYIASFLGIKPQSLSRIRKQLASNNTKKIHE